MLGQSTMNSPGNKNERAATKSVIHVLKKKDYGTREFTRRSVKRQKKCGP